MHAIYFYKDKQGNQPVLDYMRELARRDDKDSRIKLNKLNDYIELFEPAGNTCWPTLHQASGCRDLGVEILARSDFIRGLAGWEFCLTASFCQKDAKDTQTRDRESQAGVARIEGKRAK